MRECERMAGSIESWKVVIFCAVGWIGARLELDNVISSLFLEMRAMNSDQHVSAWTGLVVCAIVYAFIVAALWRTALKAATIVTPSRRKSARHA